MIDIIEGFQPSEEEENEKRAHADFADDAD
jgi:hypothetical protein